MQYSPRFTETTVAEIEEKSSIPYFQTACLGFLLLKFPDVVVHSIGVKVAKAFLRFSQMVLPGFLAKVAKQ